VRITFLRPALTTAAIVAAAGILAGGLALRPALAVVGSALVNPFTTCNNSTSCKSYKNAGAGVGLQGINTNISALSAGLLGTATQNGTGVEGSSISGAGVAGSSASASGVAGLSGSSNGVSGRSNSTKASAAGVQGANNTTSTAVRANGFGGPLFDANNSSGIDVFTVNDAGNTVIGGNLSVTGPSGSDAVDVGTSSSTSGVSAIGGTGVVGFGVGSSAIGVYAANAASSGGAALLAQDVSNTGVLMDGYDSGGNLQVQIQDNGYIYAHAFVTESGTRNGPKATTYASMASTPNVEDFGEAQLTSGQSYVSLKSTFAATIDARVSYMVFITPEGDTHGLYVTQKTPAGFVVRENQGGRSDAAFSYRIVAKPFGSTAAALRPSVAPRIRMPHVRPFANLNRVPKTNP
jgi:hypothetical protein